MIIYLLFIIDIFYKIRKNSISSNIVVLLGFTFYLAIVFSLFLFLTSQDFNLGTTGSDTLFYYNSALEIKANPELLLGYFTQHSGVYISLLGLTLVTLPFDSSYSLIFLNILIFIDTLLTLYLYLIKKDIKEAKQIITILALSGGMLLVGIQILKDTFLLFLFIEILFLNIVKPQILKTIFLLILMNYTRPHIWIIVLPLLLIDYKINKEYIKNKYIQPIFNSKILLMGIISIIVFYFTFQESIELLLKTANETALRDMNSYGSGLSGDFLFDLPLYIKLPISMIKFIFLPLPFASLMSNESNLIIKYLYFTQSLTFHFLLLSIVFSMFTNQQLKRKLTPLFLYVLFYIIVYSLIYLGNADMRLRLPMIVLVTILGVISTVKIFQNKNNINIFLLIAILYLSIPSLYKYKEFISMIINILEIGLCILVYLLCIQNLKFVREKNK
jgi:hypothetical protein